MVGTTCALTGANLLFQLGDKKDPSMKKNQFTLRSLLLRITICAVFLAVVSAVANWHFGSLRQQQATQLLYTRGGMTGRASATESLRNKGAAQWGPVRLALFNYIEYIDLSTNSTSRQRRQADGEILEPVDDDDVEMLLPFRKLRRLNLRGTQISDAGLLRLSKLPDLQELDVSGTQVTDAGIQRFKKQRVDCVVIDDPDWEAERSPLCLTHWAWREYERQQNASQQADAN